MKYTVTIGRQNGSGGRDIGRILADRLGVECYDWEIVKETARRNGITVDDVVMYEENRGRTFGGIPESNPVFKQETEIIKEFASRGPAVFVGRCADYILGGQPDVINTFICAPFPDRVQRSMDRNYINQDEAIKRVTSKDRSRADYYLRYTGRSWGDAANYHLTLNSGTIGVKGCVEMILEYIDRLERTSE